MPLDPTYLTETAAFSAHVYPPLAGTSVAANDVAAGEQALANRTQYLRSNGYVSSVRVTHDGSIGGVETFSTAAFTDSGFVKTAAISLPVPAAVGDRISFRMQFLSLLSLPGALNFAQFRARVIEDVGGTNVSVPVPGTSAFFTTSADGLFLPVSIGGQASIGTVGPFQLLLQCYANGGTATVDGLSWNIDIEWFRPYT